MNRMKTFEMEIQKQLNLQNKPLHKIIMNYKSLIKAKLKHLSFSVSFYKTLLILLFLLKISVLTAQEEPINILPPSIDNYNFTKLNKEFL